MKSLTFLLQESLILEMGEWLHISTIHDLKKVEVRIEHEGLSFLTITLPNFCKDFQKSLDRKAVDLCSFHGFARKGGLPLFLGGFLDRVFDRGTGRLLDCPSVDAIYAIRQITLFYSKLLLECTKVRTKAAMQGFLECESDIRKNDALLSHTQKADFLRVSNLLWRSTLSDINQKILFDECVPKHGPGQTADRLLGNKKFGQSIWHRRLDGVFPMEIHLLPNFRYYQVLDRVDVREPGEEQPVKVTPVPKTLKTPRIIAIEPTCMQYTQQAILEKLLDAIGRDDSLSRIVGFRDQDPNRIMARKGSSDGSLATLDLSEASDRVSNQLVRLMSSQYPHIAEGLDATRSRKADVPGHGVVRLAKFASMGSALCFPIEAMVFTTCIFLGIEQKLNRQLSRKDIKIFSNRVRVYGDDLIVPVEFVKHVVNSLETFGFKVNFDKSFWTGKFRESCGREYYAGVDVSIVKARRTLPTQRAHVEEISSVVSLRNQLYFAGLWKTARWLDEKVIGRLIPFPVVLPTSPGLGRHSFLGYTAEKMCPNLHKPLVRAFVRKDVIPPSKLDGHGALLKVFLKRGDKPYDKDHLSRAGRPKSATMRLRWVSAV